MLAAGREAQFLRRTGREPQHPVGQPLRIEQLAGLRDASRQFTVGIAGVLLVEPPKRRLKSRGISTHAADGSQAQEQLAAELAHGEHFHALTGFAARAALQVELMRVQRTDDFAAAHDAFGERTLLVRTAALRGEESAVALAEDCDFFGADEIAAALAQRDFFRRCRD